MLSDLSRLYVFVAIYLVWFDKSLLQVMNLLRPQIIISKCQNISEYSLKLIQSQTKSLISLQVDFKTHYLDFLLKRIHTMYEMHISDFYKIIFGRFQVTAI